MALKSNLQMAQMYDAIGAQGYGGRFHGLTATLRCIIIIILDNL
jgi:hypothetical protein